MSNDESDRRKVVKLLRLAAHPSTQKAVAREAARLASRLLDRHGWEAYDFTDVDAASPSFTTHKITFKNPLNAHATAAGKFITDAFPGIVAEIKTYSCRTDVAWSAPLPLKAKRVVKLWKWLTAQMEDPDYWLTVAMLQPDRKAWSFGFVSALAQNLVQHRKEAQKAKLVRKRRGFKPENNPLAVLRICSRGQQRRPIEPAQPVSQTGASPPRTAPHPAAPGPENTGTNNPDEASLKEPMDMRSMTLGYERGKMLDVKKVKL